MTAVIYGLEGDEIRWLKGLDDDPYYLKPLERVAVLAQSGFTSA